MKHWKTDVLVGLIVLAILVERLSRVGTSSADFWSKANFWTHLLPAGLFVVVIALIFLAILWVGNFLWRGFLREMRKDGLPEPRDLFVGHWRRAAEFAVLSVILCFNWGAQGRGPGPLAAIRLNELLDRLGLKPNFGITLALMFCGDAAVCFAILMGAYLLWMNLRRKGEPGN